MLLFIPQEKPFLTLLECIVFKVLSTFLRTGVHINKIDDFRNLLKENTLRLAGRKPMSDLIPFVLSEERRQIKGEIGGLPVAVNLSLDLTA